MPLKNKKWLPENNFLKHISPKEHYTNTFKHIIKTIQQNETRIREGIMCPFCNERNIGIMKFCYKCGKQIKPSIELFS